MIRIVRFFGIGRERRRWENPRSSIGERREVFTNKRGTFTCWEAVGSVREKWNRLRPEIKEHVERACESGPALRLEIFMIGRTEDTAAPKVLICSQDSTVRRGARKAIEESGILDSYPGFGLGDSPRPPGEGSSFAGRLAQEDIESGPLQISYLGDETVVLATSSDNAFGRRLYIDKGKGGRRPATAGPILHINGKIYQLTVGHAFLELENSDLFEAVSASLDDCDFDGQSDSDEGNSGATPEMTDRGKSREVLLPSRHDICKFTGNETGGELQGSDFPIPTSSSSAVTDYTLLLSNTDVFTQSMPMSNNITRKKKPKVPRRLERVGKLAMVSETGPQQALDYALLELEGRYRNGINEVPCSPNSTQRWLRVIKATKIGSADVVNVITMTASSGFLRGKLYATASYIRLRNQRVLQEVYKIRLDGKLADGDCGSGVVDQQDGHLYGHIVAGSAGTGLAYIVAAVQVFEDIVEKLGGDIALIPQIQPSPSVRFSKDRTRLEPLHIREFASKQYFSQFSETNGSSEHGKYNSSASTLSTADGPSIRSADPDIFGMKSDGRINAVVGFPKREERLARPRPPGVTNTFRSKIWRHQPKAPTSDIGTKGTDNETAHPDGPKPFITAMHNRREEPDATSSLSFEQRFYALPGDLQVYIIANLSIPDILHLRLVAKRWHKMISLNQEPISRAFLHHNPVPRFAISLYPLPRPSEIDLRYICGLWHRLLVASKLSAMMANWMMGEHFVRKTKQQRLEFAPLQARMRRRLVPLLFTIFHFFERHRELHLKRLFGDSQSLLNDTSAIKPVESQIMSMYDDDTLLQVHQVFPVLTSYLSRKLRPPSHFGSVERSLRGYHKEEAPDHVLVAILCIGGLREVLRLSEIEKYDARRTAVDDWYTSISHEPVSSALQPHRRQMGLGRWQSAQVSISSAESSSDNTASLHSSVFSSFMPGNSHNGWRRSSSFGSVVSDAGLAAGPPMPKVIAAQTRLLLPGLPAWEYLWITTAEVLLLEREVVARLTDIKRKAEVAHELVREDITDADELVYGQAVQEISGNESPVWGGLIQEIRGREGDDEGLVRWYHGPQIM
jgi:hypothetical protein